MAVVGWILTLAPSALLAMSAYMKLSRNPQAVEGFKARGYPDASLLTLGLIEAGCTLMLLVPWVAPLGALVLVGYLGGAVSTHLSHGEPWFTPVLVGVAVWLGLFFRDARVRSLLPLRR